MSRSQTPSATSRETHTIAMIKGVTPRQRTPYRQTRRCTACSFWHTGQGAQCDACCSGIRVQGNLVSCSNAAAQITPDSAPHALSPTETINTLTLEVAP